MCGRTLGVSCERRIGRDRWALVFVRLTCCAALLLIVGCAPGSDFDTEDEYALGPTEWKSSWGAAPDVAPSLASTRYGATQHDMLTVGPRDGGLPEGSPTRIDWTPPDGAGIVWGSRRPRNPQGPPPFIFDDVLVGGTLDVSYVGPAGTPADTFTVTTPAGIIALESVHPTGAATLSAAPAPAPTRSQVTPTAGALAQTASYSVWQTSFSLPSPGTIDTAQCQQQVDLMQSRRLFLGVRFPIPGVTSSAGDVTIPISFRGVPGSDEPRIQLISYQAGQLPLVLMSVPVELAPERHSFFATSMVARDGYFWAALAAQAAPTVTCPDNLALPANQWHWVLTTTLDYGGDPSACLECVVEFYACYEGESAPLSALAVQENGITCMGPQPIRLLPSSGKRPPFAINGARVGNARAGERISLLQTIDRVEGTPTVALSVASSLGVPWQLYRGTSTAPDLDQPITDPFVLSGVTRVWASAVIPEGLTGAELVTVTATSGGDSTWTTDSLWIGDWIAPPAPQPTPTPRPAHHHLRAHPAP